MGACAGFVSFILASVSANYTMIDQVNAKLPKEKQFDWIG